MQGRVEKNPLFQNVVDIIINQLSKRYLGIKLYKKFVINSFEVLTARVKCIFGGT